MPWKQTRCAARGGCHLQVGRELRGGRLCCCRLATVRKARAPAHRLSLLSRGYDVNLLRVSAALALVTLVDDPRLEASPRADLQPRIRDPTTSSGHAIYNLPGHDTVSPDSGIDCYSSHEQQVPWAPQMSDPGDQTRTPRHRFLKPVTIIDDEDTDTMRIRLLQAVKAGTNSLQKQCTNESEHRKRRHTTREYKSSRLPTPGHDDKLARLK